MFRLRVHARRELVFLALGMMEACVVAPLLAALLSLITMSQVQPLQVTAVFLCAVLATHYLARASLYLPLHSHLRSGLLGLVMLAVVVFATARGLVRPNGATAEQSP